MQTRQLSPEEGIENVRAFNRILEEVIPEPRRGKLRTMMDGKIGETYFTAPASGRAEYHSCFPGGLLLHSLNVVKNLNLLAKTLCPGRYRADTIAFVGLFHDLGKVGDGEREYYLPNKSDWHRDRGMLYEVNRECVYMPTGERSLYLLQKYGVDLSSEEYLAIKLNDGQYDDVNKAYRMKEPELALVLHWADLWSTRQEKLP